MNSFCKSYDFLYIFQMNILNLDKLYIIRKYYTARMK